MRTIRLLSVCALLLFVATPMAAAEDKWGLDQLADQLEALRVRIQQLADRASKDPRELLLEKYLAFGADEWKEKRREPRVKDMITWVFSKDCHPDLREKTADALIANIWKDPDLSSERKGRQSPRARVSDDAIKELDAKDPISRKLANHLLVGFWGNPNVPEARNYNWAESGKKNWNDAARAWKKILDKK